MECREIHKDLIFYIEGTLSKERMATVEEHLNVCHSCSEFAGMLRRSLDIIEQEKKIPADSEFADVIISGIQGKKKAISISAMNILRYAAAAAVIISYQQVKRQ